MVALLCRGNQTAEINLTFLNFKLHVNSCPRFLWISTQIAPMRRVAAKLILIYIVAMDRPVQSAFTLFFFLARGKVNKTF